MNKYWVGIISGFIATVVLSLLLRLKAEAGIMPDLNVIQDFNQLFGTENTFWGWLAHFILGSVIWGGIFALISPALIGPFWARGITFGIMAWLLMMVAYMPVMEHGLFSTELGVQAMIATLVLHIIYGLVLGLVFGWIPKKNDKPELKV